uniref:Acyltransferase n=1 Tax=Pseudictyota dubia TaxID=2749911 RepID=A0A6U2DDA3_9STRA|mmetsp:Transcript_29497/g.54741  ORF Transcript_29497/g.54741 Transcript_29497/m.54741 type:complete len:330 (+) Transcript_29497:175-1164(+)
MCKPDKQRHVVPSSRGNIPNHRWFLGLCVASVFSLVYIVTPPYVISVLFALLFRYPSTKSSLLYASPLFLSIFTKATAAPGLARLLSPILDYFDYEEAFEITDEEFRKNGKEGKRYIVACQPHGVITFVGICAWVSAPDDFRKIKTAVASAVLQTPILKNVMGIFGLTDASARNIKNRLKKQGVDGSVIIYVGGIAELFKSSRKQERLYLSNRKGFVKIALREGVDIVPCYLFGNTSVLTVLKSGPLATLSRKLQVALTYFWGKYYLPIPRDEKLLYARGRPMGLPHIPEPTDDDVNEYHAKYCEEVTRLFNKYKEKVPNYKHKELFID